MKPISCYLEEEPFLGTFSAKFIVAVSLICLCLFGGNRAASATISGETKLEQKSYGDLGFTSYCGNILMRAVGLNVYPRMSLAEYKAALGNQASNKVEVGAATSPVCDNCIQLDLYTSAFNREKTEAEKWLRIWNIEPGDPMSKGGRMQTGGWLSDEERMQRFMAQTAATREELLRPWAVATAERGVIADAGHMPFADNSIKSIFKRGFDPWIVQIPMIERLFPGAKNSWYRPILKMLEHYLNEQYRVLEPGGQVFIGR